MFLPRLIIVIIVTPVALAACDRFPRDPRGSLEQVVQDGVLRVGAIESPPWVIREGDRATGVEGDLAMALAEELGVEIEWTWPSAERAFEAAHAADLHLVIGGVTDSNAWRSHVALSEPYFTEIIAIGTRSAPPATADGLLVLTPEDPSLVEVARTLDAIASAVRDPWSPGTPALAPVWQLQSHGLTPWPHLGTAERAHVWVVPPGENALLMRVERFLAEQSDDVHRRLVRAAIEQDGSATRP